MKQDRPTPLIVVASTREGVAEEIATRLRRDGATVYPTHSYEGCLRVATATAPDMIVVDGILPARIERLLKAHPSSARARLLHVSAPAMTTANFHGALSLAA